MPHKICNSMVLAWQLDAGDVMKYVDGRTECVCWLSIFWSLRHHHDNFWIKLEMFRAKIRNLHQDTLVLEQSWIIAVSCASYTQGMKCATRCIFPDIFLHHWFFWELLYGNIIFIRLQFTTFLPLIITLVNFRLSNVPWYFFPRSQTPAVRTTLYLVIQ